jgi:hypothetical protein
VRVTPNLDTIRTFFISAATNVQYMPDICYGGGNYLVVWVDGRATGYPVYGARVTPSGAVLDASGLRVGLSTVSHYAPSVCYGGTKYLTVWGHTGTPYRLMGRFINTNGTMTDTIRLATTTSYVYNTDLAFDGTNFMVAWVEYGTSSTLKGMRVSTTGVPVGSPFTIATGVYYYNSMSLCFDGTNYCVTYSLSTYQLWGQKYDRNGTPIGSAFRVSSSANNHLYGVVIPGANNRYLNVWSEYRSTYDIYANLDVSMLGVEDEASHRNSSIRLNSNVIRDMIQLDGAAGCEVSLFDASGRQLGRTRNGRFDCRSLKSGVYFVNVASGERFKVVKIR